MLTQLNSKCLTLFKDKLNLLFFLFASILFLSSCDSSDIGPQISGLTMGTSYSVQWTDNPNSISTIDLRNKIEQRLVDINLSMSTYIPNSQLSEFNQSRETGWHATSTELAMLVQLALSISHQSNGAFDITVGPLVNLWGFGPSMTASSLPNEIEINIAKRSIGYQNLQVRIEPPGLNKNLVDLCVDLSAIAKGYAVDEVAKILDTASIQNYMVEIGGEVKGKGIAPHGQPWRIGIETPNIQREGIEEIISLNNIGVATSGDYRNFIEYEGKRYSHTIDPRTGYPVNHHLGSVTVMHESTAVADAWATAFLVLGPERALKLSNDKNLPVVLITREEEGYKSTRNDSMKAYLTN